MSSSSPSPSSSSSLAGLPDNPHAAVLALVAHYRPAFRTLGGEPTRVLAVDWAGLLARFVASAEALYASLGVSDPQRRREAVVEAALLFYREALRPLAAELFGRPVFFRVVVDPLLERAVRHLAAGVYDALSAVIGRFRGGPAADAGPADAGPDDAGVPGLPRGFVPY